MSEHLQCGNALTISYQNQRNISTATFMKELIQCVKSVLNTILNTHLPYIGQEMTVPHPQLWLRCDQLHALQIRPISYHKYPVGWTAAPLDSQPSLRRVGCDDQVSRVVATPFQEELKPIK